MISVGYYNIRYQYTIPRPFGDPTWGSLQQAVPAAPAAGTCWYLRPVYTGRCLFFKAFPALARKGDSITQFAIRSPIESPEKQFSH